MNGIAHCIFENEIKMYVGEMKNSMRNGYGELKFQNGSEYKGMWKNDVMHGEGEYITKDETNKGIYNNGILV